MPQNGFIKKGLYIESYGVRIAVKAENDEILEEIKKILPAELPERFKFIENESIKHTITTIQNKNGDYSVNRNGEVLLEGIA